MDKSASFQTMDNTKVSYNDKINAISSYFGISDSAAKYMYHRRRRGFPYKNVTDNSFLEWTIKLQNAFIKADQIAAFDWSILKFDKDIKILSVNGVDVNDQSNKVQVNKISQMGHLSAKQVTNDAKNVKEDPGCDGWTLVTTNRGQLVKRNTLRKMGFLPRHPLSKEKFTK
jgi:hypothetical protein